MWRLQTLTARLALAALSLAMLATGGEAVAQPLPALSEPGHGPEKQPDSAPDQKITDVAFEGVSLFSKQQLSALSAPFLSRPVTLANISLIANGLKKKYRERGYNFVAAVIPPQTVVGGVVKIIVLEGYVDKINYLGRDVEARRQAAAIFTALKRKKLISEVDLEEAYQRAALTPGLTVTSAIGPSSAQGGLSLLLDPVRQPWDSFFSVSNAYGQALDRWSLTGGVSYAGASAYGDKTALQLTASPDFHHLLSSDLSYRRSVDEAGTVLGFDVTASQAHPSAASAPLEIATQGVGVEGQITQPLVLRTNVHLFAALTFDASDQAVKVFSSTMLSHDRIRDLSTRLYGDVVTAYGRGEGWLELRKGLDVLGASRAGSADLSHPGADPSATIVKGSASFNTLPVFGASAVFRYQFQETARGLLVSDQFSAGDLSIVRGYDPGTATGDRAQAYGVEARSPALPWIKFGQASLFGFSEGASLKTFGALDQTRWISSVGGGVRMDLPNNTRLELLYAAPRRTINLAPADVVLVSLTTSLNTLSTPLSALASSFGKMGL
jgi:hemolysin activation/secretion protein